MNKSSLVTITLAASALLCASVDAQVVKRKPGLWETEYTASGGEADKRLQKMQEELARMPPERRAQMEEMLKKGYGMRGNTMVMRTCLTPQDVADESGKTILGKFQHDMEKSGRCEQKEFTRTGGEIRFHTVCETPQGTSDFKGRVYDITPVSMAMEMDGKSPKEGEVHVKQKT
ncbi:MAG TPA: DUF3617 domain-containing protein, partial [Casimicrobiaceae bacterium]|nr:DUF3617 domain-containing protein [Casimicrobiaceae bacterium]